MNFKVTFRLRGLGLAGILALCASAFAQERLITRLSDPNLAAEVAAAYSITLTDSTGPAPFALYTLPPGVSADFMQTLMMGDPRIVWAEDDGEAETPETTSGKGSVANVIGDRNYLAAQNTNLLQQIQFYYPKYRTRRIVRMAILDTGLSPHVPRLWNKVDASLNALPDGLPPHDLPQNIDTNGNGDVDDGVGHGTMVAGIVDLLAPLVRYVVVRVADSDGVGNAWSITKGLAFAVVSGAEIANVSLGSIERLNALSDVLDWTEANRLLVVSPIGNNGFDQALFPGGYSNVVCVSGVNPNDTKAPFSNWAGDADAAAPATGIQSTWWDGRTGIWSGTSFAAPMVASALAEGLRLGIPRTPEYLRLKAQTSGDSIDSLNPGYVGELGKRLNYRRLVGSMLGRK
ncbi:MAG TPA: S8 family serine peptidase [Fimbriimonadaceae bacterium]|nr:S8 family serine peptidase [Fimbriimonadaceae bacterium]